MWFEEKVIFNFSIDYVLLPKHVLYSDLQFFILFWEFDLVYHIVLY